MKKKKRRKKKLGREKVESAFWVELMVHISMIVLTSLVSCFIGLD